MIISVFIQVDQEGLEPSDRGMWDFRVNRVFNSIKNVYCSVQIVTEKFIMK